MTTVFADDTRLKKSVESICLRLRQPEYSAVWKRPLADWVQRSDRRLPIPFLDSLIGELIHIPFTTLSQTASIGPKKLNVLVTLLRRAAAAQDAAPAEDNQEVKIQLNGSAEAFKPDLVTEVMWEKWRETVRRFDLGELLLGSVARSLSRLPTVLWATPLSSYLDQSLSQLRAQKTYGRKRVAVVLEVFHDVHQVLSGGTPSPVLNIEVKSSFARRLELWLRDKRQSESATTEELIACLIEPLLTQLQLDSGDIFVELVRERIGVGADLLSVRQQSQRHKVTRARIYQMLDECSAVMAVRWPSGKCQLRSYEDYLLSRASGNEATIALLRKVSELFYPQEYEAVERHLQSNLAS
jgi:hypothetical protein